MCIRVPATFLLFVVASTPLLALAQPPQPQPNPPAGGDTSAATGDAETLQQAEQALHAAEELLKFKRFDLAEKVLAEAQKKLTLPAHLDRFQKIQQLRNRTRDEWHRAELANAQHLLDAGESDRSQAVYKNLADKELGDVSPAIRTRASQGVTKAIAETVGKAQTAAQAAAKDRLEKAQEESKKGDYQTALTICNELLFLGPNKIDVDTKQATRVLANSARESLRKAELERAGRLLDAGSHAEALTAYQALVQLPITEITDEQRQLAVQGSKAATAAGKSGFLKQRMDKVTEALAATVDNALTIASWIFLLLLAILAIPTWRRGFAEPKTVLSFEDLSAGDTDRSVGNQALSLQVLTEIKRLAERRSGGDLLDELSDLDGNSVASLALRLDPLGDFELPVNDTASVQLGPFSISPPYLFTLIRSAWRTRYARELYGSLRKDGSALVLTVNRDVRNKGRDRNSPPLTFEVRLEGDQSRGEVIAEGAARIAFALSNNGPTTNWESYRDFRRAMRIFARENQEDAESRGRFLKDAEVVLRNALMKDPQFMLARFHLGNVLRKLGRNLNAARHFDALLEDVKNRGEGELGGDIAFRLIAQYNVALSISKLEWEFNRKARELLLQLGRELGHELHQALSKERGTELVTALDFSEWESDARLTDGPSSDGSPSESPQSARRGISTRWVGPSLDNSSDAGALGPPTGKVAEADISESPSDSSAIATKQEDSKGVSSPLATTSDTPRKCDPIDLTTLNRIALFVRSAYMSAILFELESMARERSRERDSSSDERYRGRQVRLMQIIVREYLQVKAGKPRGSQSIHTWLSYNQALAVAENAMGRANYTLYKEEKNIRGSKALELSAAAARCFRDALVAIPTFAEAHVSLASLLIRDESPRDWRRLAEDSLLRALELAPLNRKSHHLLAKLYLRPEFAKYELAKTHLEQTDTNSTTLFEMAKAHCHLEQFADGLDKLRQSRKIKPRVDHRYMFFIDTVINMTRRTDEKDKTTRRDTILRLDEAIEWATKMMKDSGESQSKHKQRLAKVGKSKINELVRLRTKFLVQQEAG